ncbi:MAG TPA: TonB-dependent receptor, partial [Woeseiaceae bacterium]|nr:TonB-dependent receptor [Woeseiaceae bacterium]
FHTTSYRAVAAACGAGLKSGMAFRVPQLTIGVFLAGWLIAASVPVAEAAEAGNDDAVEIEEIVVVGSRLGRTDLDSPSPVLVFDASDLADAGITTLEEFSRYLPQNVGVSNGFQGNGPLRGTSGFNLRGVGLDATLTLVNGRRIAPYGSSGDFEPFVDVNSIPVAAIDRIEILTDGASAIYGSDAVAGVVNIVTRRNIEGITVDGGYLSTVEGDGDEWDLSLTGGWHGQATSINGSLSWFDGGAVRARDRDWAQTVDLRDRGGLDFSNVAGSPPSALLLDSGFFLADPDCPEYTPTAHHNVWVPGEDEACMFNYRWYWNLQQPSERLGLTASLQHELAADTTFFAEALASRSETVSVIAPTVLNAYFVAGDHPGNSFGEDLFLFYRALDMGNREFNSESTSWRLVAGFEGDWGDWSWQAAFTGSEGEADHTRYNDILADPFQSALLGEGGPNADQYYNPFGLNPQNPQEVIDQFAISGTHFVETSKERTLDFQVSRELGALPGGAVGAVVGGQFRDQSIAQSADAEELTGVIAGTEGFEPLSGDREIRSVFAEVRLPLLPALEAQLALRFDDYSDFGSTTNPKVGLGWKPVGTLLLRATWGTSFRPPTFRELYDPRVSGEDFIDGDPWRCPATGATIDCEFNFITFEFAGNPDLEPDEGETWLFGFAWQPQAAAGFSVAVDYWSLKHTNRIITSDERFLFETLPPDDNPFVIRAPQTPEDIALGIPGVITGLSNTYINADTVETDGIDLNLDYGWETAGAGEFSAGLSYTYLNEMRTGISFQQAQIDEDVAGATGVGNPWPQHRGNVHLDWVRNSHGASALLHYIGNYESPINLVVDGVRTDTPFEIDDYWQLDLQYSYLFTGLNEATLRLGCRNCLDADPPVYNYPVPGEYFHEARGAMLYLRWTQPFN